MRRIGILLIPGVVFQSVITGGGFATGREIVEYSVRYGTGSIYIFLMVFVGFFILLFLTSEIARIFRAFDYRTWARILLWRAWIALDLLFVVMAVLVCAIVLSSASEVLRDIASVPTVLGLTVAIAVTTVITAAGRQGVLITKVLGAIILTTSYFVFAVSSLLQKNEPLMALFAQGGSESGWFASGLKYIGYNTVVLPACLYALEDIRTRRESIIASVIASGLLVIPMVLTAISVLTGAPDSLRSSVPLHHVLKSNGIPFLLILYYGVLIWTLVDTGVGMIFAIIGRVESYLHEQSAGILLGWHRGALTAAFLLSAVLLSRVGIVDLVAKGYSAMAYLFIILLVGPLATVGVYKVWTHQNHIGKIVERKGGEV